MKVQRIVVKIDADLEELIPGFLSNRQADLQRLQVIVEQQDVDALRKLGHDLKGCGGAYGFEPISEIGARLEQAALSGALDEVGALRAELADYLARIDVVYG